MSIHTECECHAAQKKQNPFIFWIEVDFFQTFFKQMRQSVTIIVRNSRHTTATLTTTADKLIVRVSQDQVLFDAN